MCVACTRDTRVGASPVRASIEITRVAPNSVRSRYSIDALRANLHVVLSKRESWPIERKRARRRGEKEEGKKGGEWSERRESREILKERKSEKSEGRAKEARERSKEGTTR